MLTPVILCGGKGTRMQDRFGDLPKALVPIGPDQKPFLAFMFDRLIEAGFEQAVLAIGHQGMQIYGEFQTQYRTLQLSYSLENEPLGTGGAVLNVFANMPPSRPDLLVLNGDTICDVDFPELLHRHAITHADLTVVVYRDRSAGDLGRVRVGPGGWVEGFEEKATACSTPWVNGGMYVFSERMLTHIQFTRIISLEEELLPEWTAPPRIWDIHAYRTAAPVYDVGTPERYDRANANLTPQL